MFVIPFINVLQHCFKEQRLPSPHTRNFGETWIRLHEYHSFCVKSFVNGDRVFEYRCIKIQIHTYIREICKTRRPWHMMTSSNGNILCVKGAFCAGNSPVTGEFPSQRPVTRSFDVFFNLRPNKWLSKQSCGWWFETPSRSLCCHDPCCHCTPTFRLRISFGNERQTALRWKQNRTLIIRQFTNSKWYRPMASPI